jgi:heptaprenyl diphosphate synthase
MAKAKATVADYAGRARDEVANLPAGPGRAALVTLVDYTVTRHG